MPELMIAKASAVTSRIRLGTGVVNLPYQDPFLVAERMAFLDHLTHGRLIYGFGGGGLPTDKALFQMAPEEATPRTNESLERSEEHTSELQSLMRISYAVFCLKKKNQQ